MIEKCPVCGNHSFILTTRYGDEMTGVQVANTPLITPIHTVQAYGYLALWCEDCGFTPAKQWLNARAMLS